MPLPDAPDAARSEAGNIVPVRHQVTAGERTQRAGHAGAVVWFTGLPGSGKSTLAMALERRLFDLGWQVYTLDGDNVRRGLCADLGFSPHDREENIRRIGEVAALFSDAGAICITAFISPYRADRARARAAAGESPRSGRPSSSTRKRRTSRPASRSSWLSSSRAAAPKGTARGRSRVLPPPSSATWASCPA